MNRRAFVPMVAVALCFVSFCHAGDWPEFRGPTGQGLTSEGDLPIKWDEETNIAWKQAIPGKGWSSPIVVGGRVYLTTAAPRKDSDDLALEALCLDAANGALVWEKEVFLHSAKKSPRIHRKNSHASPTPLIRDGRLYVHFGHQGTACLDLQGNILWRNDSLHYAPVHGNGGSPILVGDLLVFSCDGGDKAFIVALDTANGKVRWQTNRALKRGRMFSFATPLLIEVHGKKQIVSPASNAVYAYDPAHGKEIWRVRYKGYSVIPRPVYGCGLVFLGTGYDSPSLLAIRPDGKGDVTDTHIAWKMRKAAPHTPSPLLVGGELYTVSDKGTASCLDARTGAVHWQQRLGGEYSASPLCGGDKIYFQSEQGTTTVVRAGKKFHLLARNVLDEHSLASPAAADGALFLRTEKHLYRIGVH